MQFYRLVPPLLVGITGVRRSGEPDLYVEFSIKIGFLID
jgi:hypothetical protein